MSIGFNLDIGQGFFDPFGKSANSETFFDDFWISGNKKKVLIKKSDKKLIFTYHLEDKF